MSASGGFGSVRICAAMVGNVNLMLGSRVEPMCAAHLPASGGRFHAIRGCHAWDADERIPKSVLRPGILAETKVREGCSIFSPIQPGLRRLRLPSLVA